MITTLARYHVEEVLPLIGHGKGKTDFVLPNGLIIRTNVGGSRLECLKRNQECIWCGRKGDIFLLQKPPRGGNSYLNLFAGHVLMTRDHIVPQSRGGSNSIDNLATMCEKCNNKKGSRTSLQFVLKMTQWPIKDRFFYPKDYLKNKEKIDIFWPLFLSEGTISDI